MQKGICIFLNQYKDKFLSIINFFKNQKLNFMSTIQKETKVSKDAKKVNEVSKINLSKFADQLSKIEVKEKRKRETMYKYPDSFSEKDINSEKGKKHRNHLRSLRNRFANNILAFAKQSQVNKSFDSKVLLNEVKSFDAFYKENYLLNDYSFKSLSQSKDEMKEKNISLFLSILKDLKK
jgi:hypothetical protein